MIAYESDHIQALHVDHPSAFLLITFATATMRANRRRFFCSNLADREKIATIGFVATRPNWYPAAEMAKAIEGVRPILDRFAERVCIGYSMGGYATIKYARALRSNVAIAICPQYSVDPSDIPPQFQRALLETMTVLKVQTADLDRDMRITADSDHGRIFAFYDHQDPAEAAHLACIEKNVSLTKIAMPYTRHDTHRCFAEVQDLSRLVALCRAADEPGVQALARRRRKAVSVRAFHLGLKLADRHLRWGMEIYARHNAAFDARERCTLAARLAEAALACGNVAWAMTTLEKLTARHAGQVPALKLLLHAYLRLNDQDSAVGVLRQLVALKPDDPGIREKLIATLMRVADPAIAHAEADCALDAFPDRPELLLLASDVARRAGAIDQAVQYLRRAAEADPGARSRHERLGYLLLEAGQADAAEAQFNRMLARDANDIAAMRGLAAVRARPRAVQQVQLRRHAALELSA